ncbi:hypothetical protein FHS18_003527 [Paenibacillus phyllosphaerae]|uniref:Uncharacterized protein n=1 Tax=Paenibacillus phyllosphaerae TaxID=274593 RepID=A0A7W5AZS6_9BACL|nr:hypothetical protein [Paenibacillus phyllosphaerae]
MRPTTSIRTLQYAIIALFSLTGIAPIALMLL